MRYVALGLVVMLAVTDGQLRARGPKQAPESPAAGGVAAAVGAQAMTLYRKISEATANLTPKEERAKVLDGVDGLYALAKDTAAQCDSLRQARDAALSDAASLKTNLDSLKAASHGELQAVQAKLAEVSKQKEKAEQELAKAQREIVVLTAQVRQHKEPVSKASETPKPGAAGDSKKAEDILSLLQASGSSSTRDGKAVSEEEKKQLLKALQNLNLTSTSRPASPR